MSDAVKWGLLVVGALAVIAAIVALPITDIFTGDISEYMESFLEIMGGYLQNARGIINLLLDDFSITMVSIAISFLILKPFLVFAIQLGSMAYRWIFK